MDLVLAAGKLLLAVLDLGSGVGLRLGNFRPELALRVLKQSIPAECSRLMALEGGELLAQPY